MPDNTAPLRKAIIRTFTRKHNLQLHASALTFIAEALHNHDMLDKPDQWEEALESLAKGHIESEHYGAGAGAAQASSSLVTRAALEAVYQQMVVAENTAVYNHHDQDSMVYDESGSAIHQFLDHEKPDPNNHFKVIGAYDMPRLRFDYSRKAFEKAPQGTLLPLAAARPAAMRERLGILRSIVQRNENFMPPLALGKGRERENFLKLTSIKNLAGRQDQRFLLMGYLCTTDDGRYALEDADGMVVLDLEEAVPGEGIFTEGCIILVEGIYKRNETLRVFAIGHPPSEVRAEARAMYGHVDFLGTGAITIKEEQTLKEFEQMNDDTCMVVISDLHLDHPKTLFNFRQMLQGYVDAAFIPFLFVLCGDFCSEGLTSARSGRDTMSRYKDAFSKLADLLASFPAVLRGSHFVFVPGPHDPYPSKLLPARSIPDVLTEKLRNLAPNNIHFTTNPCRIRYFGQEIVIFRADLMAKMLRNVVQMKSDESDQVDLRKYLVSTILDQAHLSPMTQQVRPISWEHDHALRLYPMPTTLVLADKYDRFELKYEGCRVFNPGSFRGTEYGWSTCYFHDLHVERSALPSS